MFGKINNKIKGNLGEFNAQEYVKKLGYIIIETNFKTKFGEVDIIAQDKNYLVFIEVKYRTSLKYGRPSEAVNNHKQNKIKLVAQFYIQKYNLTQQYYRFDVLEILNDDINYIINAF